MSDEVRKAERDLAAAVVMWDGGGEDGCFICEGEYIGDTPHVAHTKRCPIPVVRLALIDELMALNPSADSNDGKRLTALADAQVAYEKVVFPFGAPPSPTEREKT